MRNFSLASAIILASLLVGCNSESPNNPGNGNDSEKMSIRMAARSTDNSFAEGDQIGLYVVNYANNAAQTMLSSGNHIDNKQFTLSNGEWICGSPIYWADIETKTDFYGYYPYNASLTDAKNLAFTLKTNQSNEADYSSSDFMWGKTAGQAPTQEAVSLTLNHRMSKLIIKVKAGEGFTDAELINSPMSVSINGLKYQITANLADGSFSTGSATANIIPCKTGDCEYKAIVVPQAVQNGNLITVTLNNVDYNLKKSIVFESNRVYTFTITLSKMSGGINVGIGSWEDDGYDYGGVVE